MVKMFNKRFASVSCVALGLLLAGCGGGGTVGGDNTDPDDGSTVSSDPAVCGNYTPQVTITSVSPNSGPAGVATTVTIRGRGFRKCSPSTPAVSVEDTGRATVVRYTDTEIVATLPAAPTKRVVHVLVGVTNPSGYNAKRPPNYLGTDGTSEFTDQALFSYQ
jgi:hypothetical protein